MFLVLFKIESSAPCRGGAGLGAALPSIHYATVDTEGEGGTRRSPAGYGRCCPEPGTALRSPGRLRVPPGEAPCAGPAGSPRGRQVSGPLAAPGKRRARSWRRRPCRVLHLVPGSASGPEPPPPPRCLRSAPVLVSLRWHGGGGGARGEHLIIVMVAAGAAANTARQSARLYQLGVWQRLQSATFFFFFFFFFYYFFFPPARSGLFMCLLPPARGFAI